MRAKEVAKRLKFWFIVAVILLSGYFVYTQFFLVESFEALDTKVEEVLKDSKEVDFRKIVDKDFDEILIIRAYYPKKDVLNETGVNLNKTKSFRDGILMKNSTPVLSDSEVALVFLKEKKIVTYGKILDKINYKDLLKYHKNGLYLVPKDYLIKFR